MDKEQRRKLEGGAGARRTRWRRSPLIGVKGLQFRAGDLINWLSVAGACQSLIITGAGGTVVELRLSDNNVVTLSAAEALQVPFGMQVFLRVLIKTPA